MIIENFDKDYQVRDFSLKRGNGKLTLEWNYVQGTHFFVFVYDARKPLNLERLVQELAEKDLDDVTLMQRGSKLLYTTDSGNEKVFVCRDAEYLQNDQSFSVPVSELRKGVPHGVSIFIGTIEKGTGEIHLYPAKDIEVNTKFIPVNVEPTITYKTKLFSANKVCRLYIPKLDNYEDGAFEYHVDGVSINYPIPGSCLGKDMLIWIPKDSEIVIRVADKYKKYYKV